MTLAEDARFREMIAYEKGEQAGVAQEKRDIAIEMLKEGMKPDIIARLTGLPAEEIERLKQSQS